jgi:contact-dependent growth inhibition (CDI) system CdiI-like immunity protein
VKQLQEMVSMTAWTHLPLQKVEPQEEGRVGLLVLGKHKERFVVHFQTWTSEQYKRQWRSALIRGLQSLSSALITDMRVSAQSSHLVCWPFWRIGRELLFHNQLLFFGQNNLRGGNLDIDHLYAVVGEHSRLSQNGAPISEWTVPVSDVEHFLTADSAARFLEP